MRKPMVQRVLLLGVWLAGLAPLWGAGPSGSQAPAVGTPSPSWQWPVSTPGEQGLDGTKLAELAGLIRQGERYPDLDGLLIVRHGAIVVEEYFHSGRVDWLHILQSVTKSFTSALVGIAIARGEFKGVDEKVLDYFPGITGIANMDERKASIRLKDLLTMRSGTDFHENGPDSPYRQMMRLAKGWDKFYLDRPMLRPPGSEFLYDSGGVLLLAAMLRNRTGMNADAYAERYLFQPLGIERKFWIKNQDGHAHTGGGLFLTARDAAKFGLLYLKNGRWGGVQVVPEAWVRESLKSRVDLTGKGQPPTGYGYLWWILAPDPKGNGRQDVYAARGAHGQYIFVVPEHDMVVVVFGNTQTDADRNKPMGFFYDSILTAVRR
jgi:CubicO group peptidase (beta-lactamase class C family)